MEDAPADDEWLRDAVSWFEPDAVAVGLSKLGCIFEAHGITSPEGQAEVAKAVLRPPELARRVARALTAGQRPGIWFTPVQLLYGVRLLAEGSSARRFDRGDAVSIDLLSRWVLGLSDTVARAWGQVERADTSDLLSWVQWEMQTWYANRSQAQFGLFARTAGLLQEAQEHRLPGPAPQLDIAAELEDELGVPLITYLSFLVLVYSMILSSSRREIHFPIEPSLWAQTALGAEEITKCASLVGADFRTLRDLFSETARDAGAGPLNTLPFRNKPLLRLSKGTYLCPSIGLFETHILDSLYYTLWDRFRQIYENPANPFTQFWGYLVEAYVRRLFEAVYPCEGPCRVVWFDRGDSTYERGQKRPPDVFFVCPSGVIVFEVGSSRLSVGATCKGCIDAVTNDMEKCVISKARQLDTYVSDYRSRRLSFEGHAQEHNEAIIPVVVSFDYAPNWVATHRYVEETLARKGLLRQDDRVLPLQVLCLEELEHLLALVGRGRGAWQVLTDKIAADQKGPAKSFTEYASDKRLTADYTDHPYLNDVFNEFFAGISRYAFGRELPADK